MRIDVHQHVWGEPLLDALAGRRTLPRVVRSGNLTTLHSAGELPYVIDLPAQSANSRQALLRRDGVDRALIALSSPIGIEALDRESASELIEAHLDGAAAFGPRFGLWGPVALDRPEPDDVDRLVRRGCVGISLPAGAMASVEALAYVHPLLDRATALAVPVFVHPGPAPGQRAAEVPVSEPPWWQPLTRYVSQMQAAWLTFVTEGRLQHPGLIVVFAMLAGGAPVLAERLAARGGPTVDPRDRLTFYESSSFGPAAIAALGGVVGETQLLYGSDRPVIEPTASALDRTLQANAGRLFSAVQERAA